MSGYTAVEIKEFLDEAGCDPVVFCRLPTINDSSSEGKLRDILRENIFSTAEITRYEDEYHMCLFRSDDDNVNRIQLI